MATTRLTGQVQVLGAPGNRFDEILTPAALDFLRTLDHAFAGRRADLLAERRHRSELLAAGGTLDFVPATATVRANHDWTVAPAAPGLTDRRVEITTPPTSRGAAHALTSGAQVWEADLDDSTSPTWHNVVTAQLTLRDAVTGRRPHTTANGHRQGAADPPTVVVRPRGWHLTEKHVLADGRPIAAPLVDFGLYVFHCARRLVDAGRGPYFSLPKLENHLEARLWNDVFVLAQSLLGLPRGTIRATVLVETVTAAFEMEEILYELRDHAAGLATGRFDYLSSVVRSFPRRPDFLLPDRERITMTAPFLRAHTDLLVRTCHRRGAYALGGRADHLPGHDRAATEATLARVRHDTERAAEDGFDGSRVAHPALVPVCRDVFDGVLGGSRHQLARTRNDVDVSAADLLAVRRVAGPPSQEGVRATIAVALRYLSAWLGGVGTTAYAGVIENAASAELARCQLWQWVHHGAVDRDLVVKLLDAESAVLSAVEPGARCAEARDVLLRTALTPELPAFFTTDAYPRYLVRRG